jgi:hypothetical protein
MKLLDNLEGINASTFPKHPISVLSELCQSHNCSLEFAYFERYLDAGTNQHACGACIDGKTAKGFHASGVIEVYGIANVKAPSGGLVEISDKQHGASRRAVRVLCAEQVLRVLQGDKGFLQRAWELAKMQSID